MLAPLSWIREITPYEGDARTLGDKLTMLGLELEGIVNPFRDIMDIVVGFVAERVPHPQSDHLSLCKVDVGDEILDIVCGAPNVAAGQKVAVAKIGVKLPDGTVIKKAKLRGEPSMGMICSERELGLSDDHSGILVLPDSVDVGHKLVDALYLDTEVLDLSITPNRGDCLSILGIARETALAFDLPCRLPDLPLIIDPRAEPIETAIKIENPDLCPLYSGRILVDVRPTPSPPRLKYRLHAVGLRSISSVVDITNYILYEVGQPLHAFDLDKLSGGEIIVRSARNGEKVRTLDGKERELREGDICICDAEKIVALGGVMGGENTEITPASKNIFVESAVFNPVNIRKTSRRLGLASDASYRFERGVDQTRSVWALDRACAMMASVGGFPIKEFAFAEPRPLRGGFPIKSFAFAEPRPFVPAKIKYNPARANALLGIEIAADFQMKALENDGCAVEKTGEGEWIVVQPSWRHDLRRECDLIEEVGVIYGLDKIPPELPRLCENIDDVKLDSPYEFLTDIARWGAGLGLNEVVNYSFACETALDALGAEKTGRIAIRNPMSEDQNVLRPALAPGLLDDLRNNLAFGAQSIKLFEIAGVFRADEKIETGALETPTLGLILSGSRRERGWPRDEEEFAYADLKGLAENLFIYLHLPEGEWREIKEHPYLSPAIDVFLANKKIGTAGMVRKKIADQYNAQKPVWLGEFDLGILRELYEDAKVVFKPLAAFPAIRRDITVITSGGERVEEILRKIKSMKLPLLEAVSLLDSYAPEQGGAGRNLTFRLTFRHANRTLKDAEVDKERDKVADFLQQNLNVKI